MECVGDAGKLIFAAARDGDTVTVGKILSTAGAQSLINYQEETSGATALHCAAQNGHESVTEQLIEARCNMDLQQKDGFRTRPTTSLNQETLILQNFVPFLAHKSMVCASATLPVARSKDGVPKGSA
jgi:ankyrin repeat protein